MNNIKTLAFAALLLSASLTMIPSVAAERDCDDVQDAIYWIQKWRSHQGEDGILYNIDSYDEYFALYDYLLGLGCNMDAVSQVICDYVRCPKVIVWTDDVLCDCETEIGVVVVAAGIRAQIDTQRGATTNDECASSSQVDCRI